MLKVANRIKRRGETKALRAWRALAEERGTERKRTARALRIFRPGGRLMLAALNTWLELLEARDLQRRAVLALSRSGLRKGWNKWMELIEDREARQSQMLRGAVDQLAVAEHRGSHQDFSPSH